MWKAFAGIYLMPRRNRGNFIIIKDFGTWIVAENRWHDRYFDLVFYTRTYIIRVPTAVVRVGINTATVIEARGIVIATAVAAAIK